jgi:hypothetical protein
MVRMNWLPRKLSRIRFTLFLAMFLAACSGVQPPETAQASLTQPATAMETETAVPLPGDTPEPTLTATPAPPIASPSPAGPTPTPELGDMTVQLLTSTSPDEQWKAEALLAYPYNPQGTFVGDMDYARLTVFRTDGSQQWTPYEEWSPTGLGDSYLTGFHWSADGRYLYFSHSGNADGCGTPFVTNLRRVDLQDGSLSEIPLSGLGLDVITISPSGDRMAYRTSEGFLLYKLETGETRTLPYEWAEGFDYLVGGYAWSPDEEQLAFTITHNFCGPFEDVLTSIQVIELDSGEARSLTERDARRLQVTGWPEPERLQVIDPDGKTYTLTEDSGTLLPEDTPADPATTATGVLSEYLGALNAGSFDSSGYERAAGLYGGSYETLLEINPGVDLDAHDILFRNACRVNGFQCLRIREVLSIEAVRGTNEFKITVSLMNPDGSVFARGPCCGEETGEPQTEFVFTVRQNDRGEFKVLELPPYVP